MQTSNNSCRLLAYGA